MAKQRKDAIDVIGYKTVFWVVVCLSAFALLVTIYLATRPAGEQTETLKRVVDTCDTTWKMRFGGILGLLGGKRLS